MKFARKSICLCLTLAMLLQCAVTLTAFAETYDYDVTQNVLFGATKSVTVQPGNEDGTTIAADALYDGKTTVSSGSNKWYVRGGQARTFETVYAQFELNNKSRVNKMMLYTQASNEGEGAISDFYLEYYDDSSESWVYVDGSSVTGNTSLNPSVDFKGVVTSDKFRLQIGNYTTKTINQAYTFRLTEMVLYKAPDVITEATSVPFTVTRLKPSGNDNNTYALFNDGYFVNEQSVKTSDNITTIAGFWGCGSGDERSMVIKFDSATDITNLIFYAGGKYDQNGIVPDKVTIQYSDCIDKTRLNNSENFGKDITWTTLSSDKYTITNVTNGGTELTGVSTTVKMGAKDEEVTAKLLERAQQVVSFNFKEKLNAGSLYVHFGTFADTNSKAVYINEVEVLNRGTNVLLGRPIENVYPEIGTAKDQSSFGTGISAGGIALTDGKKDANWTPTAAKWTVKVTSAKTTPFVEYSLDGETIDELVIYSGRIPYVTANRVDGTTVPGGSVYPESVTLAYTEDGSTWKTVTAKKTEEILNSSRDSKLTLTFGEISPKKIRIYAGVGTNENSTNIQTPSWLGIKEIEAYNNTDRAESAKETVDILRADADINGDAAKRTFDTYIERDNNKLLARSTRNITLSLSSQVSDGAGITIDNGATAGNTTITTATDSTGQTMYFANADISGFRPDTKYTVTVTDGEKTGTYTFATSGMEAPEAQDMSGYDNIDIYLAIGQSNMSGRAAVEAEDYGAPNDAYIFNSRGEWEKAQVYPTDAGTRGYQGLNRYSTVKNQEWESSNGLNPLTALAKSIKLPEGTAMGIVSNAKGNTSIEQWSKGYEGNRDYNLYEEAVARANAAVEKGGRIKGIIWLQGCANSTKSGTNKAADSDYVTKFETLMTNLRTDLGAADVPVIIAEIPAFAGNKSWNNMYFNEYTIPAITDKAANNAYAVYSAGSKSIGDNTHFDSKSQRQLGAALADKINEVIYGVENSARKVAVKSAKSGDADANVVIDGVKDAYTISDTGKMWSYTPSDDSPTASIELELDGVYSLSDADIYFNNPWIYNYGYKIYTKANAADAWKLALAKEAADSIMLKEGRINSAPLAGVRACAVKIEVTGKTMIDENNCKFDFTASNAMENAATQALIGINEIEIYAGDTDYSADKFAFGEFAVSGGAQASVEYDLTNVKGSSERLMLVIAAYDNNTLAKCEIKFLDFSAETKTASGTLAMTLPSDISSSASVSAMLVNADSLKPIVGSITK